MKSHRFKLGKRPARKGAIKFRLSYYTDFSKLPTPPDQFGHEELVDDWGVLANDSVGDCVIAGGLHETMVWNKEAGVVVPCDDKCALANYSAITGYDPAKPDSDQGTDMQVAAEYRRTTGLVDAAGNRHKVLAYLAITPGNMQELLTAMYLFGAVGIGIRFPDYAMDQFNAGKPWDVQEGGAIEGGHYVSCVAHRATDLVVVTWGALQRMTPAFFKEYCDEAIVYLTNEDLKDAKTLEGFSIDDLTADLAALKPTPIPNQ